MLLELSRSHMLRALRRIVIGRISAAIVAGLTLSGEVSPVCATPGNAQPTQAIIAPQPQRALRPQSGPPVVPAPDLAMPEKPRSRARAVAPPAPAAQAAAARRRQQALGSVKSWGYQLAGLDIATAAGAPYDLLVVDATTGQGNGKPLSPADVSRLKQAPQGRRRLVVSYLSIGEAEDYRPDYFSDEYLSEDAPDWLLHENPQWKGNRIIRYCEEGWQRTILGDEDGRNVYNSIEPSPLYRLIELGLDGVYLDRVDVYSEVGKICPDAARRMVAFVKRLALHARKRNPDFFVILQNAEELLQHHDMIESIDAVAKEDLFYGADHSEASNGSSTVADTLTNLRLARKAGRPVLFVDYIKDKAKIADARRRGEAEGFVAYFAPRDLARMWLPGRDF